MIKPQKILIIQTAFIGDVVLTTPLFRAVKQKYPEARLDVLVIPQTKTVLENNPHVHAILTIDKRGDKRRALRETVQLLHKNNYDLCFLPHRSLTSARLACKAKIPHRIGFAGQLPSIFYSTRVPFDKTKNQIGRYLDLLKSEKHEKRDLQTEIFLSSAVEEKGQHFIKPLQNSAIKIAIAPGSVWPTKRWPENYFIELIKLLVSHNEIGVILLGSPDEKNLCERIAKNFSNKKVVSIGGETTLAEAAAIIKACHLLICNDSGSLHLANAVQTDVFAFFGPTVQNFGFAPFRSEDKVFEVDLACRPCRAHGGPSCPKKHFRCMLDIEPRSVYNLVRSKFNLL